MPCPKHRAPNTILSQSLSATGHHRSCVLLDKRLQVHSQVSSWGSSIRKSFLYRHQLQSSVSPDGQNRPDGRVGGASHLPAAGIRHQQARQTPSINCLLIKVFKVHLCQKGSKETLNHENNYSCGPGQWNWFIMCCSSDSLPLCLENVN